MFVEYFPPLPDWFMFWFGWLLVLCWIISFIVWIVLLDWFINWIIDWVSYWYYSSK